MKLNTVFCVSSGSYSDYRVLAVFENERDAKEWAQAVSADPGGWHSDAFVEELLVVPAGAAPYRETTHSLSVELWDNGKQSETRYNQSTEYPIASLHGSPPARPVVRFVRAPCHNGKGGRLEVKGRTRKAIDKVAADRIRQWQAAPRKFPDTDQEGNE